MTNLLAGAPALLQFAKEWAITGTMTTSRTLNIYFALWAVCIIASILSLLILIPFAGDKVSMERGFLVWFVAGGLLTVATVVFQYLLLYQGWRLIPADIARTIPGKAIGFLFIPIFNLYWMFVAYNGLGKDMNKTFLQRGIQFTVNEKLGLCYCIWCLIFAIASCIPDACSLIERILPNTINADILFSINFIAQIVWVVAALISIFALIAFLRAIKNGTIALLEQESVARE